jgi:hypothetical protein
MLGRMRSHVANAAFGFGCVDISTATIAFSAATSAMTLLNSFLTAGSGSDWTVCTSNPTDCLSF